jgi:hypothetical protein
MKKTSRTVGSLTRPQQQLESSLVLLQRLVHSWWPWRSSLDEGNCVLRTQEGWLNRPCDEFHAFICQRDTSRASIPLAVRCGHAQPSLASINGITTSSSASTATATATATATIATTTTTTAPTTTSLVIAVKLGTHAPHAAVPFVRSPTGEQEIPSASDEHESIDRPGIPSYERIIPSTNAHEQRTTGENKSSLIEPSETRAFVPRTTHRPVHSFRYARRSSRQYRHQHHDGEHHRLLSLSKVKLVVDRRTGSMFVSFVDARENS